MRRSAATRWNPLRSAASRVVSAPAHIGAVAMAAGLLALVSACVSTPPAPAVAGHAAPPSGRAFAPAIDGMRQPRAGLYTGGQPPATAWKAMAAQGVTTIINLRPDTELGTRDEAAEVREAGLAYRLIAVAGTADITALNASRLWTALRETPGTTAVHCSSGNRAGALLAIGAALEGGMDTESAIAFGRAAGLGAAETRVREVLAERAARQ